MISKELTEARWKAIIGIILIIITFLIGFIAYELSHNSLTPQQLSEMLDSLSENSAPSYSSFDIFMFVQSFSSSGNTGLILMVVAALLGAPAIANEASRGTIFLLLSRPLSRKQILLAKLGVSGVILLGMGVFGGIILVTAALVVGSTLSIVGVVLSVFLYWLGTLFILGLATFFSILLGDTLRALIVTIGIVLLLTIPGLFPGGSDWVLIRYWSNLPAFLGQEFPIKNLIVSLLAAAVPLIAALPLFRSQNY